MKLETKRLNLVSVYDRQTNLLIIVRRNNMAKRIFIAFAIEDIRSRNFLVGQARNENSPFEFVDMSVKQPWETDWETKCQARIRSCHGVIALISKHTPSATGQLFEIRTAEEEHILTMMMYSSSDRPTLPYSLSGKRINIWSWENIKSFIDNL